MKTKQQIQKEFLRLSSLAPRIYFLYWFPLGSIEQEFIAYGAEDGGKLKRRCSNPLERWGLNDEIRLHNEQLERIFLEVERACAPFSDQAKVVSFRVRDPAEMCVLLMGEGRELFVRIKGVQESLEAKEMRATLLEIFEKYGNSGLGACNIS